MGEKSSRNQKRGGDGDRTLIDQRVKKSIEGICSLRTFSGGGGTEEGSFA